MDKVNILKKKYYQGYHPLIVKKKLNDIKKYVTDSFTKDISKQNLIGELDKFDYMLLINSPLEYKRIKNYMNLIPPIISDTDSCCYIEIRSHGTMVVASDKTRVDINIPKTLDVDVKSTSQISNYSYYTHGGTCGQG